MKRIVGALTISVALGSCATSSGVMIKGADVYAIERRDTGPVSSRETVKGAVYAEAEAFCVKKGMQLKVLEESFIPRSLGQFPEARLDFTCSL